MKRLDILADRLLKRGHPDLAREITVTAKDIAKNGPLHKAWEKEHSRYIDKSAKAVTLYQKALSHLFDALGEQANHFDEIQFAGSDDDMMTEELRDLIADRRQAFEGASFHFYEGTKKLERELANLSKGVQKA